MTSISWVTFTSGFFLTLILVGKYIHWATKRGVLDVPNERSSHKESTARGGGIVFFLAWLLCLLLGAVFKIVSWETFLLFAPGAALVALIGLLDDLKGLSAKTRLAVHFIAAVLFMWIEPNLHLSYLLGFDIPTGISFVICLLTIGWSINLFNFMDGTDGFATTEGLFVFGFGGLLLTLAGLREIAFVCFAIFFPLLGFFAWNKPKAKVFMGDVGSGFLGFLVATCALASIRHQDFSGYEWLILYGLFWFDASITLGRRMLRGEKWYLAHKSHAFQRLHHKAGWSHRAILMAAFLVNLSLSGLAYLCWLYPDKGPTLAAIGFSLLLICYIVTERIAPFSPKPTA